MAINGTSCGINRWLFTNDDLRITIWEIRALARGSAERERRGRVELRAELVRKLSGGAKLRHKGIFDFQVTMTIWEASEPEAREMRSVSGGGGQYHGRLSVRKASEGGKELPRLVRNPAAHQLRLSMDLSSH